MFKALPGMNDILPQQTLLWQEFEGTAKKILRCYGYQPIITPILEDIRLFNRSLGGETEIVTKQMFVVRRETEDYVLRPEGTAGIARAYIENNLNKKQGFSKLYYIGPMFRAERPQKGRLRQFHHIGVEALGSADPYVDSEVITLAKSIIEAAGISGYRIKLNSLGCPDDKKKLAHLLNNRLKLRLKDLCLDCNERFKRSVLRILDCKNEPCRKVISELKLSQEEYLCDGCMRHFAAVRRNLDNLGIAYSVMSSIVRGLDYYTRTVFEISHPHLGAQDAIGAGGRYDRLIYQLGGEDTGAVGFALGIERLFLARDKPQPPPSQELEVYLITLGASAREKGFILLDKLRAEFISADMDFEQKSLKGQLRRANDLMAKFCVILGEDELKKGVFILKNMSSGGQQEIDIENFVGEIKKNALYT